MEKRFLYYIAGGVVLVFLAICIRLFTGEVLVAPGHTSSSEPVLPKVTPTVVPTDLPSVVHTDLATSTIAQNDTPYASFIRRITDDDQIGNSVVGIQFFGDIMLDRSVARMMGASGTAYVFEHLFGEYNGLDQRVDLTIANLEGPFAPTRVKTSKSIAFRFDPKFARELRDAGFDVVSLANNHTLDMGWKNVDFTHKTLDEAGVAQFGDQARESREFTHVTEVAGHRFAFVGLNNTDHVLDLKRVSMILADARKQASTTLVMMHWGEEYQRHSNSNQRSFAHFLIDNGADVVIGAHPHVVQEAEIYKNKPIFYSLGNFVFDQYFSQETQEGLSIGLVFEHGSLSGVYAFPLRAVASKVWLMDGERRDAFYQWLATESRLGDKTFEQGFLNLNE